MPFKVSFAGCALATIAFALPSLPACVPSADEASGATMSALLQATTLLPSKDIGTNPTVTSDTYASANFASSPQASFYLGPSVYPPSSAVRLAIDDVTVTVR